MPRLTDIQLRVMKSILKNPNKGSLQDISVKSGVPKSTVDKSLKRLIHLGLLRDARSHILVELTPRGYEAIS